MVSRLISVLSLTLALFFQCNGLKPAIFMNSLFISGNYHSSRVSTAETFVNSPAQVSMATLDDYSRSIERTGAVYRSSSGKVREDDSVLFKRWVTLLKDRTAVTPSIFNMLDTFVVDSMPFHLAASLTRKLYLLDLNAGKASHLRILVTLFNKVFSRRPLSFDQLLRFVRSFAVCHLSVIRTPNVTVDRMLMYLGELLCEVYHDMLPNLLRHLSFMELRFQSMPEKLSLALLHHVIRFSDSFNTGQAGMVIDSLGNMRYDFRNQTTDPYVKEAILFMLNKALKEWSSVPAFEGSSMRSMFLGMKTSALAYPELNEELRQSLNQFAEEKVKLMNIDNQLNFFRSMGSIEAPWTSFSPSNREFLELTLVQGLQMDLREKDSLLRAMVSMGLTEDMLAPETQQILRSELCKADKKSASSVLEVLPALNIEWSSVPSETQQHLLNSVAANVKFLHLHKLIGLVEGLSSLGVKPEELPPMLVEGIKAVLFVHGVKVKRRVGEGWAALSSLGLSFGDTLMLPSGGVGGVVSVEDEEKFAREEEEEEEHEQ